MRLSHARHQCILSCDVTCSDFQQKARLSRNFYIFKHQGGFNSENNNIFHIMYLLQNYYDQHYSIATLIYWHHHRPLNKTWPLWQYWLFCIFPQSLWVLDEGIKYLRKISTRKLCGLWEKYHPGVIFNLTWWCAKKILLCITPKKYLIPLKNDNEKEYK